MKAEEKTIEAMKAECIRVFGEKKGLEIAFKTLKDMYVIKSKLAKTQTKLLQETTNLPY